MSFIAYRLPTALPHSSHGPLRRIPQAGRPLPDPTTKGSSPRPPPVRKLSPSRSGGSSRYRPRETHLLLATTATTTTTPSPTATAATTTLTTSMSSPTTTTPTNPKPSRTTTPNPTKTTTATTPTPSSTPPTTVTNISFVALLSSADHCPSFNLLLLVYLRLLSRTKSRSSTHSFVYFFRVVANFVAPSETSVSFIPIMVHAALT